MPLTSWRRLKSGSFLLRRVGSRLLFRADSVDLVCLTPRSMIWCWCRAVDSADIRCFVVLEEVCQTDVACGTCTVKRFGMVMFCCLVVDKAESQLEQDYRAVERVSVVRGRWVLDA